MAILQSTDSHRQRLEISMPSPTPNGIPKLFWQRVFPQTLGCQVEGETLKTYGSDVSTVDISCLILLRLRFKLGTMHYEGDEVKLDKARVEEALRGRSLPFLPESWKRKITLSERNKLILEGEGPIFHFHDYGRKGRSCIILTCTESIHLSRFAGLICCNSSIGHLYCVDVYIHKQHMQTLPTVPNSG